MSNKVLFGLVVIALLAGVIPFALIARSRSKTSHNPAIHMFFDMDKQGKFKPQRASHMFADGRQMRPHIQGTVAQEDLQLPNEKLNDPAAPRMVNGPSQTYTIASPEAEAAILLGRIRPAAMTDAQFAALAPAKDPNDKNQNFYVWTIPADLKITQEFLQRGQERYTIYCLPCHGESGYGDGMVHRRAADLQAAGSSEASGWTAPKTYHDTEIRNRPDGHLYNTITHGIRSMAAYDKQISVNDRWAIVAYIRALQRSQNAQTTAVTPPN